MHLRRLDTTERGSSGADKRDTQRDRERERERVDEARGWRNRTDE